MAIRAGQDDRPGAAVAESGCFPWVDRDDVDVFPVPPQQGISQHRRGVSGGNHQHVTATAQDAVQRAGPAVRAHGHVGYPLPGSRPAPVTVGAARRWITVVRPAAGTTMSRTFRVTGWLRVP